VGSEDSNPTRCPDWTSGLLDPAGPVLADAIVALVQARPGQPVGDASAVLQALVDLIAEAQASIADAVVAARDQHYSWDHIAGLVGISPATAIRRYRRRAIRGLRASPPQRGFYQPEPSGEGR
jgi:hypothetical protein